VPDSPSRAASWPRARTRPTSSRPLEDGPLKVYNWDQYIDPEVVKKFEKQFKKKVTITTFQNEDEAMAKLQSGSVDFDVYFPSVTRLPILVSRKLLRPLNHDYLPNLPANVWPELADPFYDKGAQYAVPYTVFGTGIVWRNDKVKEDIAALPNPWTALWDVGGSYKGKVAILDDPRDAMGMALFRNGETDVNTEDPAKVAKALQSLKELDQLVGVKVSIAQYQTVPEGKVVLAQDWSGDQIAGALYYLPQGVKPDVLSWWKPSIADPAANDLIAVLSTGKNPVLAHTFLNFMLDETNAYDNFVNFNGYQPPMTTSTSTPCSRSSAYPTPSRRRSCSATTSRPASPTRPSRPPARRCTTRPGPTSAPARTCTRAGSGGRSRCRASAG